MTKLQRTMLGACAVLLASPHISFAVGPVAAQDVEASTDRLANAMNALDGRWVGTEMTRAEVLQGPWQSSDSVFVFAFDANTSSGEVRNEGQPVFIVRALDGYLLYGGEIGGEYREQRREVVEFWPRHPSGDMKVVARYVSPGPGGALLEVQETYQVHQGTYIRRQEVRPANSDDDFTLIRDARFTRE